MHFYTDDELELEALGIILLAQVVSGLGYTFVSGATEAKYLPEDQEAVILAGGPFPLDLDPLDPRV